MPLYFYANQKIIQSNSKIPKFYKDIHNLWMFNFHKEPSKIQDVIQESIWLNRHIICSNSTLNWKLWIDKDIITIGDLLDKDGLFLSHQQISRKYNMSCNFLQTLQIRQSVPYNWRKIISSSSCINYNTGSTLKISCNNVLKPINKLTCKEIYWHIINKSNHKPPSKEKWHQLFPLMKEDAENLWPQIYKLPFTITRETKLQSFQYKIIHRIIACNKWLFNIKIKDNSKCNYCNLEDDIKHFFILCENTYMFWEQWHNWWKGCTNMDLSYSTDLFECILLGYKGDEDIILVLNFCTLLAKYYIYTMKMCENNNLDMYQYLVLLKQKLAMERNVLKRQNNIANFGKFDIIFSNL